VVIRGDVVEGAVEQGFAADEVGFGVWVKVDAGVDEAEHALSGWRGRLGEELGVRGDGLGGECELLCPSDARERRGDGDGEGRGERRSVLHGLTTTQTGREAAAS
jgi:hypothetical protein